MLASVMLLVALLAFLSIMVLRSTWQRRKFRKLPPGPTPLPFIGNYLQLDTKHLYNSIMKISKHYGPVFTIHLGTRWIVVLCGYDAVKEALLDQAEDFSGRGEQATLNWISESYGVAFANGERAKQLKRFSLSTLRDFGMGKRGIEERIQEEAGFVVQALENTGGTFIDPTLYMNQAACNIISSIIFGDRFDYEDKEFLSLMGMIFKTFQFIFTSKGQLLEMFTSVMRCLPGPQQEAFKNLHGLKNFVVKKVEENQHTLDPHAPRNFIDSFLIRMQEEKNSPNSEFCMKNLVMTTMNFFFGGTETVSTTLRCGFLLLMKHPDVEAKIHEEIDQVIGRNRKPKYEDRVKMPYTDAVIHEIQRFADLVPMSLAHRVTKDTNFRGFLIPKGTEVFPMLGSVLKDPKFFPNPGDFNPQHFLDEKGQFKKSDAFIPFSIGKRSCIGEGLAKMELFLFLTTILQNFHIKSQQAPQDINISPPQQGAFTAIPSNYKMSFLSR
ncbi:cytochrome P450 2A3 isoform X1 [Fukomys damarensis]|uniref:cytochrome P450 2A3 isoform X1 n=1 Tax=Fukomys damarensis TaxID=885580 RepID=UPI00053F89EC|nr:cytochrome P450 2A3 isoform X1 [Fukomys damarensis]